MSGLADYVDSQWLRDKLPPQAPKDDQSAAQFITDILGMIAESKKVWTFERMLGVDDDKKSRKLEVVAVAGLTLAGPV